MAGALAFPRFRQAVRSGALDPVYVLEGEEEWFHDAAIRLLEEAALPEGAAGTDRESLRGDETSLQEILDRAATYPMGAGRRLVLVRRADALRFDDAAPLLAYLARPNPKACLVLSDVRFDRRKLLRRALEKGATFVACAPLDEAGTAAFVRERLRERGFGIGADLAEAIAAGLSGAGLGRIEAEIQKLMDGLGAPRPVTAADLAILADVPRVEDAFRLAAQVARGERGEAIISLRALLGAGEEPVQLLGALAWYFRNALRARIASDRRLPPRQATALYGLDPGRIERFRREIGGAGAGTLRRALALCLRADREIKGGGAKDPAHAFERLIHALGGRDARRTA